MGQEVVSKLFISPQPPASTMRMWMIKPELLCTKHLLGEHGEIHKHRHNFVKKHNMHNRIAWNQIEPKSMKTRHDALAEELLRRGYNHNSPYEMPDISYLPIDEQNYIVDVTSSHKDLCDRCEKCKEKLDKSVATW